MYAAHFVGDYDQIVKAKQRAWYIDTIPIGRFRSISLTPSDTLVLENLKLEYLKNIDNDVDRHRGELQEQDEQQETERGKKHEQQEMNCHKEHRLDQISMFDAYRKNNVVDGYIPCMCE